MQKPYAIFGLLFLLATAFYTGAASLENYLVVKSSMEKADALVLMAGSRNLRLPAVVNLYKQGVAPIILLANDGVRGAWSEKYKRNLYLVEWAREYLLDRGIPGDVIKLLDFIESGTYFDALNARAYVLGHGKIDSLLVVTSDYHTRRTLWTFNRVFAGMDVRIDVYPISQAPDHRDRSTKTIIVEFVKLLYYRVRYGLLGFWV